MIIDDVDSKSPFLSGIFEGKRGYLILYKCSKISFLISILVYERNKMSLPGFRNKSNEIITCLNHFEKGTQLKKSTAYFSCLPSMR